MSKTAVIILNWNGEKLLLQFLPSVVKYSALPNVEIIVADNASTDDSRRAVETFHTVRWLAFDCNYGFAQGYNLAIEQTEADYILLLNSDVEVTENYLQPLVDCLDKYPNVAAVQPKIKSWHKPEAFEYAGAAGGFIDRYGYPFCRGRLFDSVEDDNGQYDRSCHVFWASGACMLVRRTDYLNAGGLDSRFFAHMEEIDLCWRLLARGKEILCLPEASVYHVGGATLSETSPHKTYLNFRNNRLLLYKNLPPNRLKPVMRTRLFLDCLAAFQLLASGKMRAAGAVLKALYHFHRMKKDYTTVRRSNMEQTTVPEPPVIYPQNLLWQYYAKRRKTYKDLQI
jgi:GT2 family glycosyltransferase